MTRPQPLATRVAAPFVVGLLAAALVVGLLAIAGVGIAGAARAEDPAKVVILATTTSTVDSGLLDALVPAFQQAAGYAVKTISVGSGQAMAMGRRGEADVLLVHSPADEQKLVEEGAGIHRRLVMHNDFVIVGPANDPAQVKAARTAKEAMARIAQAGALFVSRGDGSGTHSKEMGLWKAAGMSPEGQRWLQQTGLGMGATLNVASEKGGYTLTDRATWLALSRARKLALEIVLEKEPLLLNVYHVVEINPARWPRVNGPGGRAFADFMVAPATQASIGTFGVEKFGAPLFVPDAGKDPKTLGL